MRHRNLRGRALLALIGTASLDLPAGVARANGGFGLNDGLADWTGNAYVGEAAKAYDAGTAWTNPAGMVLLAPRFEADGSVDFIDPDVNFRGVQVFGDGTTVTAPQSRHGIDPAVSVAGGAVLRVSDRLAFGIGSTAPFASRLSFTPQDYVGTYQSINAIPTDIQAVFSAAYRINSHLSIGGGPVLSYFKDRQTHALALGHATVGGQPVGPLIDPSDANPIAEFRGDDYAVGYDLGGLYQLNPDVRFGVNYHSAVYHRLEGFQTVYIPPQLRTGPLASAVVPTLQAQSFDAYSKVALPGWVDGSVYVQVTPNLALLGSATWTNWSLFQNERVNPLAAGIPVTTNIQFNFRDTVTGGIGANYVLPSMKRLMLQGGVSYDESPVDNANRQAVIPDADRVIIGIGTTYRVSRMTTLALAYTHYFIPGTHTIDNGIGDQIVATPLGAITTPSGRLVGRFDLDNNALIVGVKSMF